MTRNRLREYPTSYGINRRNWHNWPDPERDDTEAEGLPLPANVDPNASYSVSRNRKQVRR